MVQRALLLLQQSRYDLAEQNLRQHLAQYPEDAFAHALLAYSLVQQQKHAEAESSAHHAIGLAPDLSYGHFILGWVKLKSDDVQAARKAVDEAIRLDPEQSEYHGLRAAIFLGTQQWREALDAANEGLRHDPKHQECLNYRAMALVKLNRHDEAHETIGQALQDNPENDQTHANLGWAYLHRGEHQKALEHFSEALRLDPNFDYARQGLVEALKARYFIYRWLLRFFLWMSTLSPRVRAGLIIGMYVVVKGLATAGKRNPAVAPFVIPVVILYGLFVLLTWVIDPAFNLLLQFNKYGRYAMSKRQRWSSAIFGVLLLGAVLSVVCGVVTGLLFFYALAANLALMIIPATHMFKDHNARIRRGVLALVAVMILLTILATLGLAVGQREVAISFSILNLLAAALFTWYGAILGLHVRKA